MNERPSGLLVPVSVTALVLLAAIVGWRMLPDPQAMPLTKIADPNEIILPDHLAKKTDSRYPVYTDRLTKEWSRKTVIPSNFMSETLPLDNAGRAEVRCNGDDSIRYTVDAVGRIFVKGKQVTKINAICEYLEVRAGSPESIGKPYVVSLLRG